MAFTATNRRIVGSVGLALVGLTLIGCGSKDGERQPKSGSATDPRLIGKWKLLDGNFKGTVAEFTSGGKVLANLNHKWMPSQDAVGSYSATGNTLEIVAGKGVSADQVKIEVEYQTADAIVMVVQSGHAFGFDGFGGRWQRVGGPTSDPSGGPASSSAAALDFTGLRGVLSGKWEMKKEHTENHTLEFTSGGTVFVKQYGFGHVGKYESKDDLLMLISGEGARNSYGLEYLSDGELALRPDGKVQAGSPFNSLEGRWHRVSLPAEKTSQQNASGPIADANRQVQKIEQKLAKLEAIQKAALANRDELAAKLRSVGVNSPADLKGNIRGMRLAKNAVELATEIEGLEQQLAVIDTALLRAKSLVRQMESEQSGLSPDELRKLAEQLKEVESRTVGEPLPVTPLDVDAAVEKALKARPAQKKRAG